MWVCFAEVFVTNTSSPLMQRMALLIFLLLSIAQYEEYPAF